MTVADPEELRRVAERVLDEAEFREAEPGVGERIVDRIGELIGELFGLLGGGGAGGLVGWALIGVAIGGLVWLVVRLVPDARPGSSGSSGVARPGATIDVAEDRDPESWDAEAEQHEAAGRWDDALRARYRSLVARLARRGAVRDAPAVTTGEHRSAVDRLEDQPPVQAEVFASTADRFDEVWYGGASAERDDVERTRRLADEVDRGG